MIAEDKPHSLYQLFQAKADEMPESVAMVAPGRAPLTYSQLLGQINHTVEALEWKDPGKVGTKTECLAYIKEVRTDMRPLSLKKKMEDGVHNA